MGDGKASERLMKCYWKRAEWSTCPTLRKTLHVFSLHHAWLHHHHSDICKQQWCQQYKPNIPHHTLCRSDGVPPPSLFVLCRNTFKVLLILLETLSQTAIDNAGEFPYKMNYQRIWFSKDLDEFSYKLNYQRICFSRPSKLKKNYSNCYFVKYSLKF